MNRHILIAAVLFSAAGCTAREHATPDSATAISGAAVPVVRTSRADLLAAPPVQLTEEVVYGPSKGPQAEQFSTITHTALAPDGTYYTLDATDNLVRVFDASGKRLREFGRQGEGPGEFESPGFIAASNDTVIVFDDTRLHLFTSQGTLLATVPYVSKLYRGYLDINGAMRTPQGFIVLHTQSAHSKTNAGKAVRDTLQLRPMNVAKGELGTPVVTTLGLVTYLFGRAGWIRHPYMAASPQIVAGRDGRFYVSPGDDYRILVYSPEGAPVREIAADVEKIPVTWSEFSSKLNAEIQAIAAKKPEAESESGALLATLRADGEKPGHAANRPILGRIIPSPEGAILVERLDLDPRPLESGDSTQWDFIDAQGRVTGRLALPPRMFPRILNGDQLYIVVRDDDNIPQVTRFRLSINR